MKAWNRKEHKVINGIEYKHCGHCHKWKVFDAYGVCTRQWDGLREVCKECRVEETKRLSDKRKIYFKKYHAHNKRERNAFMREYFIRTKYNQKKRQESVMFRLYTNFGNAVRHSLIYGKRRASWETILGYTRHDLRNHLEAQFTNGMSWDNYGEWHIDHIRPVVSFLFSTIEDENFKQCWALDNLQPLWAHDNLTKGGKY